MRHTKNEHLIESLLDTWKYKFIWSGNWLQRAEALIELMLKLWEQFWNIDAIHSHLVFGMGPRLVISSEHFPCHKNSIESIKRERKYSQLIHKFMLKGNVFAGFGYWNIGQWKCKVGYKTDGFEQYRSFVPVNFAQMTMRMSARK